MKQMLEKVFNEYLWICIRISSIKISKKLDRDAFDTLFDHAPDKLSLVENVN